MSSLTWSEEVGDGVRVATQTCHVDWQETSRTSPAIGGERERGREGEDEKRACKNNSKG